jgi:hypothetical protein
MVKLKIAEAMAGKPTVIVPSGTAGTSLNRLDLNKLIETVKSETAAAGSGAESTAK